MERVRCVDQRKTVLDLCAAPGGKTVQLAKAGAEVVAVDHSEARLKRLGENLERLGVDAYVIPADLQTWEPPAPADIVLLDAPCSATGTLRKHPEVNAAYQGDVIRQFNDVDISVAER